MSRRNKPSAIQNQLQSNRSSSQELLQKLKLGMWVELERAHGKRRSYCLISTGDSSKQVYSFVRKTGFGLVKKNREQVSLGLANGSIRMLDKKPKLARISFLFARRMKGEVTV